MADQVSGLLSPFLRNRRLAAAEPHLRGRVLDFGCGTGRLARGMDPALYLGVDQDRPSLEQARTDFPGHRFLEAPAFAPAEHRGAFDTVAALAVIEHLDDPGALLRSLGTTLREGGRFILTTPHPSMEGVHHLGSALGLFSREANQEHKALLRKENLRTLAEGAGLTLVVFERFLLGANQLCVLLKP